MRAIALASAYSDLVRGAFAPGALPTMIPRLVTLCLAAAFGVLAAAAIVASAPCTRSKFEPAEATRSRPLVGAPHRIAVDAPSRRSHIFATSLWQLFRGPVGGEGAVASELSRRYTELLFENLGQPGFRELIVATLDLETRGDLVFAALREERRAAIFSGATAI